MQTAIRTARTARGIVATSIRHNHTYGYTSSSLCLIALTDVHAGVQFVGRRAQLCLHIVKLVSEEPRCAQHNFLRPESPRALDAKIEEPLLLADFAQSRVLARLVDAIEAHHARRSIVCLHTVVVPPAAGRVHLGFLAGAGVHKGCALVGGHRAVHLGEHLHLRLIRKHGRAARVPLGVLLADALLRQRTHLNVLPLAHLDKQNILVLAAGHLALLARELRYKVLGGHLALLVLALDVQVEDHCAVWAEGLARAVTVVLEVAIVYVRASVVARQRDEAEAVSEKVVVQDGGILQEVNLVNGHRRHLC
mmetsp:Transcript_16328/g.32855  ORF Transcript_16328/g.32855 Transcript_16328/m.32855 type:complete len:307 (+) Transcript_16328:152-1072(+)